eukprot:265542-Prorocentrum_minimum.AAC.1
MIVSRLQGSPRSWRDECVTPARGGSGPPPSPPSGGTPCPGQPMIARTPGCPVTSPPTQRQVSTKSACLFNVTAPCYIEALRTYPEDAPTHVEHGQVL